MVRWEPATGALSVFSEPSTAVERSLEVQRALAEHPFKLRIGLDMGQISVKSSFGIVADVFGRHVIVSTCPNNQLVKMN